jgi:Zn2+/Cd2+-exporting ATPase
MTAMASAQPTTWASLIDRERQMGIARIILMGIAILLFELGWLPLWALLVAIAFGLYPLVKTGLQDLIHARKIGTEIFVTIATVVAVIAGEYAAAAILMTIILVAEFIADLNTDRARASIKALIGSVPQVALVREGPGERTVAVADLRVGDIVLVRGGEKLPVDGVVIGGQAAVNEATITGESVPVERGPGDSVLAGTLVETGALDVRTEKLGQDTLFSRIVALVENAEAEQAPVQKLADKVASWLIPLVFAFLVVVFLATRDLRLIVTLLIFTSPAEIGLATPLVMIAAIARAARSGILVKGGIYLESLAKVDVIVFDKTGTLTVGAPEVTSVQVVDRAWTAERLLSVAAAADRRSGHPLAKAVVSRAQQLNLDLAEPTDFEEVRGRGVKANIAGQSVYVGNALLLEENGITVPTDEAEGCGTRIYVAVDQILVGSLDLGDRLRPGAKEAIDRLKASGIKRVVMLTGDHLRTAQQVAAALGGIEVQAELLPEDKVNAIVRLQKEGGRVAMVGDGVNDAPALARAEVGIAMGARGTQAALEAADIALMTDDLGKIVVARTLARRAYRTIQENIFVGVGVVHVLGITAGLIGLIGPIQAAVLHLGPDILVFLNSIKLLRVRVEEVAAV